MTLRRFDTAIASGLADLLGLQGGFTLANNAALSLAQLPLRLGGLGLRSVETEANAAYVSSMNASYDDVQSIVGRFGVVAKPDLTRAARDYACGTQHHAYLASLERLVALEAVTDVASARPSSISGTSPPPQKTRRWRG
jgi:hypothetical protein